MRIELTAIAHPKFHVMEWCKINLKRYHIKNLILLITKINFKFQAGKAPTMDICLNDFTKFNIDKSETPLVTNVNTNDARSLGKALGTPQAIRQWIDNNIKYQFYMIKEEVQVRFYMTNVLIVMIKLIWLWK